MVGPLYSRSRIALSLIGGWEGMTGVMHRREFKLVTVVSECYFTYPHVVQQTLAA